MNKIVSLALLAGGIILIVIGINATNSFSSDVSRLFTGSPTDKAMWMLVGGIIAAIIGLMGTLHSSKQVLTVFRKP
jgi:small neutral amino acid transporter SnatA (MarC family)